MWIASAKRREAKVRSILDSIEPTPGSYRWEVNPLGGNAYLCVAYDPDHQVQILPTDYEEDGIHLTPEATRRLQDETAAAPSSVFLSLKSGRYYVADRDLSSEIGQAEWDRLADNVEELLDRYGSPVPA